MTDKMNILFCTWNYPPVVGGIEQVAHYTALELHQAGHHVEILAAAAPAGDIPAIDQTDGIPIFRAQKKGIPRFLLHAVREGNRRIRAHRPDWIFCPSLTSAPAAWLLSKRHHIPYAVCIYGSDIVLASKTYQLGIRPLLTSAKRLFPISRATTELLTRRGIPEDRICMICPGVTPPPPPDTEPSDKIKALAQAATGAPVVLTVGRLVRRKGVLEFIRDVFPLLKKRLPQAQYWVVGGEPKASLIHQERIGDQLEAARQASGYADSIHLLGRCSDADLDWAYRTASVFVLPCLDLPHDVEGFGIVLLEAALKNVPSVATRCGGIPDAVLDGETGLLVPPGQPEAMAETLADLLQQPERLATMGRAGERRAREFFNWTAVAARYAAALQAALPMAPASRQP